MTLRKRFAYIAFYDLDHTILTVNSATYLVEAARTRGIMSAKQYRHAVYLSIIYKLDLGDPTKMITRMLTWLKGLSEKSVKELCREVYSASLVGTIRGEILATMEEHRRQNGAVVLLSSATAPVCEPVRDHLEMDDMICTRLVSKNGILTGATHGRLVYAKEKKVRLKAYCKEHGYDPGDAYYYGDSHTDHHVMESVGNPVAVSPDKRLRKRALKKNWPIIGPPR